MATKSFADSIHPVYKRIDLWLFLACIIIFVSFPQIDLYLSNLFFKGDQFLFEDKLYAQFVNWLFSRIHLIYFVFFIFLLIKNFYNDKGEDAKIFLFLISSLTLSYGLAQFILPEYTFGRPAPFQIEQFGGISDFAAVFQYSGACTTSCSFVSGHTAVAFFLAAFAWLRRHHIWITQAFLLASTVGLVRILQGFNFLSDVVFAMWICWFCCVFSAKLFKLRISS